MIRFFNRESSLLRARTRPPAAASCAICIKLIIFNAKFIDLQYKIHRFECKSPPRLSWYGSGRRAWSRSFITLCRSSWPGCLPPALPLCRKLDACRSWLPPAGRERSSPEETARRYQPGVCTCQRLIDLFCSYQTPSCGYR